MTRTRRQRQRKGFTLLELLMVVIIIAILASIALPQYIRASEKARASEALQLLGAVRSAQVRYRALSESGVYTGSMNDLDVELPNSTLWDTTATGIMLSGGGTNAGGAGLKRLGGQYANQTIGLSYGSGTICGTFEPLLGGSVSCTND